MCVEILVERNGQQTYCRSIGDLRAALPHIRPQKGYGKDALLNPKACLCPVDVPATARVNKLRWSFPDWSYGKISDAKEAE